MLLSPFSLRQFCTVTLALTLSLYCQLGVKAASFINPASINLSAVIPPPPQPGTEQFKIDTGYLKNARATSTQSQIDLAKTASYDNVFDYADTLGSWFNNRNLPKTAALFTKVDKETKQAIELAKHHFERARPLYWLETGDKEKSNGYSYPSGHTTRAFVWAGLLSNAFPDRTAQLHRQARQKAWYRVILGRHYPADVRAGKLYGKFLAAEFLKNPDFQKQWSAACEEMHSVRSANTNHF
jgi:acid phosphatase (class A)